jgi:hypothetical protein
MAKLMQDSDFGGGTKSLSKLLVLVGDSNFYGIWATGQLLFFWYQLPNKFKQNGDITSPGSPVLSLG